MTAVNPDTSRQAAVEAALVLLERMGLTPADLTAVPQARKLVPTFADYIPVVSSAVSAGTRRAYGSYWNRVVEHWGSRRLDEPTPSEIRQLMAYVKTHVVARRNARGGRSAEEHLVAALRCLYQRAVDGGLIGEADNPARKVAKPRRRPSTRRAVPDMRLAEINQAAAATGNDPELDTLLLRLHTETACRRGGALALRPDDLDPDQCLIRLREKGETVRWQPVSATLMGRLIEHGRGRHAPPDGQLLRYANGRPITSRRYDHLWIRLGRHLPWVRTQQISMHWIRHTTLTWVEGRGVASDATFPGRGREEDEHPGPGLQLLLPPQRAGRVREQSGDDLRCHHPVALNQAMLQLLLLHPVIRMMQQMQQKAQRQGRMPYRPLVRLRYSAGLVNRSLPVSGISATPSPAPTPGTPTAAARPAPRRPTCAPTRRSGRRPGRVDRRAAPARRGGRVVTGMAAVSAGTYAALDPHPRGPVPARTSGPAVLSQFQSVPPDSQDSQPRQTLSR
jgi:integrase/recombinase XerC